MDDPSSLPAVPSQDDIVDRIAAEIGSQVAYHIETMYPAATEAVAWESAKRSIVGVIRNAVASAGRAAMHGGADGWIRKSRADRKRLRKLMRKSPPDPT